MKKAFATLLAGVLIAAMPLTIAGAQTPAKQTGTETGTAKDSTPPRDPQQNAAPAKSAPAPATGGSASKEQKKGTETGTAPDTAGPAAIRDVPGAKKN